jgi:hypothetical protein
MLMNDIAVRDRNQHRFHHFIGKFSTVPLIIFFAFRYHDEFHSIFPMGDISALIPDDEADVCVLEEPEHLNW